MGSGHAEEAEALATAGPDESPIPAFASRVAGPLSPCVPRRSIRPWLSKWYLDCMTRGGDCLVGYAGTVRLGPIRLPVTSALLGSTSGATTQLWRVMDSSRPERAQSGDLRWSSGRLGIHGIWAAGGRPMHRVLHDSEAVTIIWECAVPGGRSRVRFGEVELEGYGYAERLSVAGDPAALGLREVRWGHFAGPSNHLVWLSWLGAAPMTLVLRNGEEVPGASVPEADGVVAGGHRLVFGPPRVLRNAVIADTIPVALRVLVPPSLRGIREEKWIAAARLENGMDPPEEGWTIYERVVWP